MGMMRMDVFLKLVQYFTGTDVQERRRSGKVELRLIRGERRGKRGRTEVNAM
jgi:hypothetical protein